MGQVPDRKYAIFGDGKVARHFSHYLSLRKIPHSSWSRRTAEAGGASLEEVAAQADTLLLLISDSAIEPFIAANAALLSGKQLVHFSGSLFTPRALGMHPLQSFWPELYRLEVYEKFAWICDGAMETALSIFPELKNEIFPIDPKQKALYHALCVLAGNGSAILWQKLLGDFDLRLNLPAHVAYPYLEQLTANLLTNPSQALTGPIQRQDFETIEKNLGALKGDDFEGVYRSLWETQKRGKL